LTYLVFSPTGVEEFFADGAIMIYNIRCQNSRENAIEVLKKRGEKHQKKIVVMNITEKGIVIHPREVYSEIE
jgi:KaiC/GvpD/RAD55 family RecA-like ATPase